MQSLLNSAYRYSYLKECATRALEGLAQEAPRASEELASCAPDFLGRLGDLLAVSPPMLDTLRSHPDWIGWLRRRIGDREMWSMLREDYEPSWRAWLDDRSGGPLTLDSLRAFKRREYLAIAFRDLSGAASFEETVLRLSSLADLIIRLALQCCWDGMAQSAPEDLHGCASAEGFAVIALGKLGGGELNYSSDIDLIFCRRPSDAEGESRFYMRLGERLIHALSRAGPDGFLYRVDMRLRPHGETGPLVPTLPALMNYYESWGEAWERQALIKARPVAGSDEIGNRFRDFTARFTFARQTDDSSLEELKRVKHRAEREYAQDPGRIHVKQGAGGIRDIEFYVQYLQLITGWSHAAARASATLSALEGLSEAKALLDGEWTTLSLAYLFLRTVEHRLQLRALTPQAVVPSDDKELLLLATGLGFGPGEPAGRAFLSVLQAYRLRVRTILERIYLTPGYLRLNEREEEFARLLSDRTPKDRVRELLSQYGFDDPDKAWQNIRLIALGPAGELLPPRERRLFLEFVFPLLEVLRDSIDPDLGLHHLESFAAASGNRVSFLRTLASRRPHLSRLTNLLALSNLAHQILLRHPEYFDSLARGTHLHQGRHRDEMHREINERLGASPRGENAGTLLRRFRQREMVRVAYRDLAGLADAIEVSNELSELGQACVQAGLDFTRPSAQGPAADDQPTFYVIALGKLGSRLMHYASDLDLMFIYESPSHGADPAIRARVQQEGEARVERFVELLSGVTFEGVVYDLDLRLRPEGSSGLLARSWESFMDYARLHIEPWERLALVRSRPINGNRQMEARWNAVLAEVVYEFQWTEEMFEALRHLKRRIEAEKSRESRINVDFKYGRGGVVDLEFLVQWLQIRNGPNCQAVRTPSLTTALPALQASGAIRRSEYADLLSAHRFHRFLENRYQLLQEWNSREISRESPLLGRLARSMGYRDGSKSSARRALLSDWDAHAAAVRALVENYLFSA